MRRAPTVTIAGAGVLGLATALALADAGCAVTVHDPGRENASSVAAGMIAPVFEAVLDAPARPHFNLLMAARDLWPALAQRAGITLDRSGALAAGADAWLDQVAAGFQALSIAPTEIGPNTAQALAPGLDMPGPRALMTREDWRLDAPSALQALTAAAVAAGVVFKRDLLRGRGGADVMVLATGAAAHDLAPELAWLSPIKGHIVRVVGPSCGAVVRGEDVYAAPGAEMVFGATMESGRRDTIVDDARGRALLAAGLRLFPALTDLPVTTSVGIRAATPDGLPMVGASLAPGVLLAVGARRNGWLLAPLVAQRVAACVTERDPGPYAAWLDPARFRA